jgi:very-short-patch-repair endonuclease
VHDERALELATARHGVVAMWELRRDGVPAGDIRWLQQSRHWELVAPGVLRRVGSHRSTAQALAVGVLGCGPSTAAATLGAARWWGLTGCAQWPLDVVGTRTLRHVPDRVRYRQIRRLPGTWTTTLDGVPVVRPELLALQLFGACRPQRASRLVDSLWSMRVLSGPSIATFLGDMGAMGRNGTAGLREILAEAGIEVRRQVNVGSEAWTGRVDGLVVGTRVVIEIQSWRYHGALVDHEADALRIKHLEADGFTVVEVTDDHVWSDPGELVRRVSAAIVLDRTRR